MIILQIFIGLFAAVGIVILFIRIAVMIMTTPLMARTILPNTVFISASYQSLLRQYKSGMLPTTISTIIQYSRLVSASIVFKLLFTKRTSVSLDTTGINVSLRVLSF